MQFLTLFFVARRNMNVVHFLVIVFVVSENVFIVNAERKDRCDNVKTSLNVLRKRRHLTFPEGTSMVLTMSVLKAVMVHAPSGWNVAVEIDVLYPLLSPEMTNALYRKKFHHRQKREFWERMESALEREPGLNFLNIVLKHGQQEYVVWENLHLNVHNALLKKIRETLSYNLNGRSCIYRSICEARTHLAPPGKSLVHDILRTIFSAPVHEKGFKEEVNETYYELLEPNICERIHDCPISILEAILGLNKNSYI